MTQRIIYRVERRETVTEDELASGDVGLCDCIVVHSINGQVGGPGAVSTSVVSLDGVTGQPLTPAQLFQVWVHMAAMLESDLPFGSVGHALCGAVLEEVRGYIDGKAPR